MRKEFLISVVMAANGALLLPAAASAEGLGLPGKHADEAIPTLDTVIVKEPAERLPLRGASQSTVLHDFGEPDLRHSPAGGAAPKQPPITRWDYPTFSVFFERKSVIDVVVKDKPAPLRNTEELQPVP